MFFSSLNKVFDFIEQNLHDDISINSLGNILGTNEDTLKRIFTLICGMSIAEYIKKRRLTICVTDLKTMPVIDVAVKYGYNSQAGFSRAFKEFHGILPSEVKKNSQAKLNALLPFKFSDEVQFLNRNYQIIEQEEKTFCGECVECNFVDIFSVVNKKWKQILKDKNPEKYYGIIEYLDSNQVRYWFCLPEEKGKAKITLPKGQFLVLDFDDENKVPHFSKFIYQEFANRINRKLKRHFDVEIYEKDKITLMFSLVWLTKFVILLMIVTYRQSLHFIF